jgi:hypothetical protein
MSGPIPVVLFAYARPDHLRRTLAGLKRNGVPRLYAFSDGPDAPEREPAVAEVRRALRAIDWCEVRVCERRENLGLGRSILSGVGEVCEREDAWIVCEDDLECVPGAYAYLAAALAHYAEDARVGSVTGWTHPRVTPPGIGAQPYFDGRAECLLWGAWRRSWVGMEDDALSLLRRCRRAGIDVYRYGADLPYQAEEEQRRNVWAVRFLYLHMLHGRLCLRPPRSMVEHIGFDALATCSTAPGPWASAPLGPCPPLPAAWPQPVEHPDCPALWQQAFGTRRPPPSRLRRVRRWVGRLAAGLAGGGKK